VPLALLVAIGVTARPRLTARVVRASADRRDRRAGVLVALGIGVRDQRHELSVARCCRSLATVLIVGLVDVWSARRPRWALACAAAFAPLILLVLLGPLGAYAERRSARQAGEEHPRRHTGHLLRHVSHEPALLLESGS
jgi:hypothetical protein